MKKENQAKIFIGSEKQVLRYAGKIPVGVEWKWCYFGNNVENKEKISKLLSGDRRHHYAGELYKLSRELRPAFLDWIALLSSGHADDLNWRATALASKSPLQSDLFLLFCYFNLMRGWAKGLSDEKRILLVIIEDPYLHQMAGSLAVASDVLVKSPVLRVLAFNVRCRARVWLKIVPFLKRKTMSLLRAWYYGRRYQKRRGPSDGLKPGVLIYTWIEERSFKDGSFRDVYMGPLAGLYGSKGENVATCCQPDLPGALAGKMLGSGTGFVLTDRYLKAWDLLKILFLRVPAQKKNNANIVEGIDYTPLFTREYLVEKASPSFWDYFCFYFAFRNCFSKNKQLKLFVYPFENQPWEKMVLSAAGEINPGMRTAGYQHTSVPLMELNYYLGKNEHKCSPVPDYIITNGSYNERIIKSAGFEASKIVNGGSLRYSVTDNMPRRERADRSGVRNILLLLYCTMLKSSEIIFDIKNITATKVRYKILIKPHPDLSVTEVERVVRLAGGAEIISSGSLDSILDGTDLVVHAGSTAALEAVYKGLPLYKVDTEFVDMDILDDLNIEQYRMTEDGKIDLDRVDFSVRKAGPGTGNIISEPMKEDVWLSLLQIK